MVFYYLFLFFFLIKFVLNIKTDVMKYNNIIKINLNSTYIYKDISSYPNNEIMAFEINFNNTLPFDNLFYALKNETNFDNLEKVEIDKIEKKDDKQIIYAKFTKINNYKYIVFYLKRSNLFIDQIKLIGYHYPFQIPLNGGILGNTQMIFYFDMSSFKYNDLIYFQVLFNTSKMFYSLDINYCYSFTYSSYYYYNTICEDKINSSFNIYSKEDINYTFYKTFIKKDQDHLYIEFTNIKNDILNIYIKHTYDDGSISIRQKEDIIMYTLSILVIVIFFGILLSIYIFKIRPMKKNEVNPTKTE